MRTARVSEAEVALRVAFWLLDDRGEQHTHAQVAIDGATVRIKEKRLFDILAFLKDHGCEAESLRDVWRGTYRRNGQRLTLSSKQGFDVQVRLGKTTVKVECKGGRLEPRGKSAGAVFASAIGQAITCSGAESEELWIAVPDSKAYENTAKRILSGTAFRSTGIRIALVAKQGVRILAA